MRARLNTANLGGLQKYEKVLECICGTPCEAACGADPFCTANRCGFKPSMATPACKECSEASCCEEAFACFDSTTCKKCFTSQAGPECATDPEALAYYQCASQACGSSCTTLEDPTSHGTMATTSSTDAATTGAGGGGVGGAGATSTSTGTGGKEPETVTECACQNAGSGDYASWPWALGLAGLGAVIARRRSIRQS